MVAFSRKERKFINFVSKNAEERDLICNMMFIVHHYHYMTNTGQVPIRLPSYLILYEVPKCPVNTFAICREKEYEVR